MLINCDNCSKILGIVFIAWFFTQAYKVITPLFKGEKADFMRFFGSGGMPSSHSASVMALVTSVGLTEGFNSSLFAISLVFAIVVMYDAAGVRRAAGRQAKILNKIIDKMDESENEKIADKELKELLGHTPVEVIVGGVIGCLIAIILI